MANSAAAIEITDIFHDIVMNNLRYCALCLRTEKERRLVEPTSFLRCLCIMRVRVPSVKTICFVCEAAAARAVSLFQAVGFAGALDRWRREIAARRTPRKDMPAHLCQHINKKNTGWPATVGLPAQALADSWRHARRLDLAQTEVLVVGELDSSDAVNTDFELVHHETQTQHYNRHSTKEITVENVVIIEDDDILVTDSPPPPTLPPKTDPSPRPPRRPPSEPPLRVTAAPSSMRPSSRKRRSPAQPSAPAGGPPRPPARPTRPPPAPAAPPAAPSRPQSKLPVMTITPLRPAQLPPASLPTLVPLDKLQDHPDAAAIVPNEMQIVSRHQDTDNYILHPIVSGSDGQLYVPSLRGRLAAGRLLPVSPGTNNFATVLMPGDGVKKTEPKQVQSDDDDEVQQVHLSVGELIPCGESEDSPGAPPGAAREARLVPTGRIDWEDKIPMDVISFVDATDPHSDLILSGTSPAAETPTLKRPRHDVIDLC